MQTSKFKNGLQQRCSLDNENIESSASRKEKIKYLEKIIFTTTKKNRSFNCANFKKKKKKTLIQIISLFFAFTNLNCLFFCSEIFNCGNFKKFLK